MQDSAPNPAISKYVGRAITAAALPLSKYRHVFDIGNLIMQREYKRAEVTLDYMIDLMSWLEPDENITACSAWTKADSLVVTRLEFAPYAMVIWLAAGGDKIRQTVYIDFSTSKGRAQRFIFSVVTEGTAPQIITVSLSGPAVIKVGKQHQDKQPEPVDLPTITVTPAELAFPITFVDSTAEPKSVTMQNTGNVPVFLRSITVPDGFLQKNTSDEILQPGASANINITFEPKTLGDFSGPVHIDINDGGKDYTILTGLAAVGERIHTSGSQFVDGAGTPVRLRSINWFGAETTIFTPHGLWARSYKSIIDQIKAMGFNCVRLPFSSDLLSSGRGVPAGAINTTMNPELAGKTAIEVFDSIIEYLTLQKMYVVLDHHRVTAGDGADGTPIGAGHTLQNWIDNWLFMAARYGENAYVIGADIHNEPYALTWAVWATYAEQCGDAIHTVAPEWIIFVEGVGTFNNESYWWGGQLAGVATRPVTLQKSGRLAYSPHEYGQSSGQQSWLAYDGQALPANWPKNLYGIWRKYWGFIVEQDIAPVFISEFGGRFGTDGAGNTGIYPHAEYESQWLYNLENYLNGDFDGNGTTDIPEGNEGISFSFWAFNPDSGDTGGIVQDDWTTPQALKLRLLDPIMAGISLDYLTSLNPISSTEITDGDLLLVNHNGTDFSIRVSEFMALTRNKTYEPGSVHWFVTTLDPNVAYVGQTWVRVPAPEKTVRIAKADGSDLLTQGGTDNITIGKDNLPAVALSVSGNISEVTIGNLNTSGAGGHSHTGRYENSNPSLDGGTSPRRMWAIDTPTQDEGLISAVDDHTHTVNIGPHGHELQNATTEQLGNGADISIKNAYVVLAAWYRVS